MPPTTVLTDLPPELLSHITDHLHHAASIAHLGQTSQSLRAFVDKDAWRSFSRTRFPTTSPQDSPSFHDTARTLTTLSRAFDKRAFVARCVEPTGDITAFPGRRKVTKWKRPRGQTIGFTPHLDVYEDINGSWHDRQETLAFSAGAEVCIRHTSRRAGAAAVRWTTYRPFSAYEGRDDVTCLHLVRPGREAVDRSQVITGTANGDLQLITFPYDEESVEESKITYFTTQGMPVRSSSLLEEPSQSPMLAASLGDASIALYQVDAGQTKISPSSQVDLKPGGLRPDGHPLPQRIWSTKFLSSSMLAVGVGPSTDPVQIFSLTESGISKDPIRKFGLKNVIEDLENVKVSAPSKKPMSSIYTINPLPSASGSGNVFLTGAYDGIVRLHDMRSSREIERRFIDPSDDSPIYSILPRGQEKLMVGTGRHNLLKVFDLRMGAKCYEYPTEQKTWSRDRENDNFNVYLRTSTARQNTGWNRNRPVESSVYSLASSSPASPFIYAGLESSIVELAVTETLDRHPDPAFFDTRTKGSSEAVNGSRTGSSKETINLAMHDQGSMSLYTQKGLWQTLEARDAGQLTSGRLDARWESAAESQ